MVITNNKLVSVVVPLYNEAAGLHDFHDGLMLVLGKIGRDFEVIYVDDGSHDQTAGLVKKQTSDKRVKLISFSRNFGKELALTAGISQARGEAIITLDGDGQHPAELIPEFIKAWQDGAQVVVGLRTNAEGQKHAGGIGSRLFYHFFNALSSQKIVAGSTDYRLITAQVREAFLQLNETDRVTRGLIDWLGFEPSYVKYTAKRRQSGVPGYSRSKLFGLAINSFVSLSPAPLYLFGGLGIFLTLSALLLGCVVFIEQLLLGDPLNWDFTGTAQLSIVILFFVGLILMSQGMLSLYVSHIHSQSKQRPLYVIDFSKSAGIEEN
ncbi:MAG: glycosyltransferase family 2 protein [Candidatus Saccharibacteria bacterium]